MKKDLHGSNSPGSLPEDKKTSKKGISRRGFLKGAGLTTAGTVMLQTGLMGQEASTEIKDQTLGPDAVSISVKVNGQTRKATIEPRTTLAELLREHLGLTGTKIVCDRGSCSACTVLLDNNPVNSCITLALDVGNKEVTTIEGLANEGELHPLQEAFIKHDAMQCGFCTPGMVITGAQLLEKNSNPSMDDVKRSLRGNLCRCGTYPKVFDAVLDTAKKM